MNFIEAMKITEGVLAQYKIDQLKWWKRLDGTPMLNDLAVLFAEAFMKASTNQPVQAKALTDDFEIVAINRYRMLPDGEFTYKVVAGDGTRSLFRGTKAECDIVSRKLTEAFLDGAYATSQPSAPADVAAVNEAYEQAALICDKSSLQPAIAERIRALKSADPTAHSHIGVMEESGVRWLNKNPHAWPIWTNFYAAPTAQPQAAQETKETK